MAVKYGMFEMPTQILVNEERTNKNHAQFIAEPFERVFGHTIGNAMRRVLLSALEAPAIVSVRMDGVLHEFMPVEGVIEDMTHIILNLKGSLLRKLPLEEEGATRETRILTSMIEVTQEDLDKEGGSYDVLLGDLIKDGEFEVVNPSHKLFTATQPMKRQIDLRVMFGRGYVSSDRIEIRDKVVGEIVMDAIFSPVRLVNYWIENTRVGQDTDFDRLILDILTDGRVTPQEAVSFASQICLKHFDIFNSVKSFALTFDEGGSLHTPDDDDLLDKLSLRIDEIELSVRSTNCLSGANIETIAELVLIPERRMLEFKNFGKKSLSEIKQKLTDMGLGLGMDLSRWGVNSDNVKEKMRERAEAIRAKKEVFINEEA